MTVEKKKDAVVWKEAEMITAPMAPAKYRQHSYGEMKYGEYGRETPNGWEIDRDMPEPKSRSDNKK